MRVDQMCANPAPGRPGVAPRWTGGSKDGIGTAYSTPSHVWFTLSRGIIEEVYYPTADRPQVRDLQYLVTDGETFFHDERRDLESEIETLAPHALGFRVINREPEGRYTIYKEIIADPHFSTILIRTRLEIRPDLEGKLRLFALLAPHLEMGGRGNDGRVVEVSERRILFASKTKDAVAMAASIPFLRCSAGYVGVNDGWTDLAQNKEMDWEFDCAPDGNIALTGELDLKRGREFTLCLAFGQGLHDAVTALFQSLGIPFEEQKARFVEQWERAHTHVPELKKTRGDGGRLQHTSQSLLLAHEDKLYPGAIVASLSIPWGEAKTDTQGEGGYHIVWTRDMVNSATGLLATGNTATPLRALIYLAVAQRPDGGFYQNFWVDGEPYWHGVQLDEVAYPIILAWRLWKLDALQGYDPYPMIRAAARYLIQQGPATAQDRWEEAGGYSPSTLATNIAALACAADMMRQRGNSEMAAFAQDYADFLESHVERWTVTTEGTIVPEIAGHYIRITPVDEEEGQGGPNPNRGTLWIANRPPGARQQFPAKEVVSGDFLELVRYGIRPANDPLIEDSIQVIDRVLKVETPHGPVWRRYNHDGYGQRRDGEPFLGWGKGSPWPLLTGERGHYELAAGRPADLYIRTLESIARRNGLLPEQVWDGPDLPTQHLYFGGPTGAATPLLWAHAEYIKLIRSAADGQVFDRLPPVADRYLARRGRSDLEIWKHNHQVKEILPGATLRLIAEAPFCLRWTRSEWQEHREIESRPTALGLDYADILVSASSRGPVDFTFYWPAENRWEERDYRVAVV